MGENTNSRLSNVLGITAFFIMSFAAIALLYLEYNG